MVWIGFLFTSVNVSSQTTDRGNTVTGVVVDEVGEPLPGAMITVKGTTRGVITDADGNFQIDVKPTDALEVSYIGYEINVVPVGDKRKFTIPLKTKANELAEVSVVAFAKQKKESVIASITTVTPDDLKIPSSNLTTALAGRMAGLISYQRSGEPGRDNAEFFIRGVTTFGYKKDPLILIDNNEVTTDELVRLQPDDIASFSIMKDATATALYGSRGANGVILVTTKEGREGKVAIEIRFEEAISQPTQKVNLADPITYMLLHNESVRTRNPLGALPYSQSKIDNTIAGGNPYVYPVTDWYGSLMKNTTNNHRLNFSLSGGGNIARYYLSGSVINDNGLLKVDHQNNFNNNVKLNRYMLRSNVNIKISPTTDAKVLLQGSFDGYTGPVDGGDVTFKNIMRTNPVLFPPYYAPDKANQYTQHILYGNYGGSTMTGPSYLNPYADMTKGYQEYTSSQMLVQFELKQKLEFITPGLDVRAMFNTNRYAHFDVNRFYNPFYYQVGTYNRLKNEYTLYPLNETTGTEYLGYTEGAKTITSATYFESALNWAQTYNEDHAVGALLVYTMREQQNSNAGDLQKSLPYRNIGFAGRATYAYASRYFLEANFGYNGSERFAKKERYGFFPSIGAGYFISNEKFFPEDWKKTVTKLKLKGTYGLVGNDAIGSADDRFFYLSNVTMNDASRAAAFGTYGNYGTGVLSGVSIQRYANEDITWETAAKTNIGLELGLFNKLEIQADYFTEYRTNILMDRASIPTTMGLQASVRANVGEASSSGIDLSVNYNHSFNLDTWLTGMGNFTYATSEFKVYEEPNYVDAPWRSHVGYSLNQTWGYVAERLFVDEDEVRNSPTQFGDYLAGDIKYKDINKDGKITELDMVPIGYPTSPEIVYGFGLSGGKKNVEISFFFQGLARESFWMRLTNDIANGYVGTSPFIDGQNALLQAYADSYWSESNRDIYALWPRLSETYIDNNTQTSTWYMRDGSFIRLKQLDIAYNVPKRFIAPAYISKLKVYFSGLNLLTFSKFKLWDPEMGGNGLGYPIQKVFNIGLKVEF
jgi:TonB-linked SusC/RagA family outer membrane protein